MPKVIKSEAVIEEKNPFIVNLPVMAVPDVQNNGSAAVMDDLDFFKDIEIPLDDSDDAFFVLNEKEDDDSYLKYFSNLEKPEQEDDDKKYYINLEENTNDNNNEDDEEKVFDEADDQEETNDDGYEEELHEEQVIYTPSIEEQEEEIISAAHEKANNIIEEAKKEAENIRMKLVAEISEAEVKKELAKSMAQNTLDDAHAEADKIIETANEAAKEILEKAKNDGHEEGMQAGTEQGYKEGVEKGLEEGRRTGYDKGHQEGFSTGEEKGQAEGYKKAYDEMSKQLSDSTQKAKDILIDAQKEKERIINSSDKQVIEIAMAVAGKILNKEITDNPFSVLQIVKEAISKVSDQPRIFITVSADNYELVNTSLNEMKRALGSKQEMSVVADTTLGPGDVIIGTGGSGDVDARLETQISEIRKTIEMVMHQ